MSVTILKGVFMKISSLILMFFIGMPQMPGSQVKKWPIPGLMKPASLAVSSDRIFISEGAQIHVFNRRDLKKIRTVGKEGEGPHEFMVNPGFGVSLRCHGNVLVVNSKGKLSLLSTDGDFISERKAGPYRFILPFAEAWVGQTMKIENGVNHYTVELLDENLGKLKEIWRWEHAIQDQKKKIMLAPQFQEIRIQGERLVLAPDDGMTLTMYDKRGRRVNSIGILYENIALGDGYRKKVMNFFKTDPKYKDIYPIIEEMACFPPRFPAVKNFHTDEKGFYIQTYEGSEGESVFFIFNKRGEFSHQKRVPYQDSMGLNILPLDSFHDGLFYQLVENETDDIWELWITAL